MIKVDGADIRRSTSGLDVVISQNHDWIAIGLGYTEEFCRAIYTTTNLEWPTAPDLGPLREALLDLRARWNANGTTVEEITYLLKVAEDMEIIPPVKPDPMREVKEALCAIADDPCRSNEERKRALRAWEALS